MPAEWGEGLAVPAQHSQQHRHQPARGTDRRLWKARGRSPQSLSPWHSKTSPADGNPEQLAQYPVQLKQLIFSTYGYMYSAYNNSKPI